MWRTSQAFLSCQGSVFLPNKTITNLAALYLNYTLTTASYNHVVQEHGGSRLAIGHDPKICLPHILKAEAGFLPVLH
jgi:hypothetical protein